MNYQVKLIDRSWLNEIVVIVENINPVPSEDELDDILFDAATEQVSIYPDRYKNLEQEEIERLIMTDYSVI